jgi:nitrogen fixation NifU-like protein
MLTEAIVGKTRVEVGQLFSRLREMLTAEPGTPPDAASLGKLAVFSGVCEFPNRVKCASLVWHTLENAFGKKDDTDTATTE